MSERQETDESLKKISELREALYELIRLTSAHQDLSSEYKYGYTHVAEMIIKWCDRTIGDVDSITDVTLRDTDMVMNLFTYDREDN